MCLLNGGETYRSIFSITLTRLRVRGVARLGLRCLQSKMLEVPSLYPYKSDDFRATTFDSIDCFRSNFLCILPFVCYCFSLLD